MLEAKREALTGLLVQLVGEQQRREEELMKRLVSIVLPSCSSVLSLASLGNEGFILALLHSLPVRSRWNTRDKQMLKITGSYNISGYWKANQIHCLKR